ncbi:hypothetical protein ES703_78932 [subsurface metagenome]
MRTAIGILSYLAAVSIAILSISLVIDYHIGWLALGLIGFPLFMNGSMRLLFGESIFD